MKEFDRLVEIMKRVKAECPWDKQQTHKTLRQYLLEEAYEVIEALDMQNDDLLREELGDLQIQIIFHALLAEDRSKFNLADVFEEISDKLVRRHPHIFADTKVDGADEVLRNWEQIKLSEGKKKSALDGVPAELPALARAYRMQNKASKVGFDWPDMEGILNKLKEELEEFEDSVKSGSKSEIEDELGDLLFSIANLARKIKINPEDALRSTNQKFINRFHYIEKRLKEDGVDINEATLKQMDEYWEEAKGLS